MAAPLDDRRHRCPAVQGTSGSACRLSDEQLARLAAELDRGPAAHGWVEDQRWTLARVTALIAALFRTRYTLRGVSYLLHRIGYSPQMPKHRAAGRDEEKITAWRRETWAKGKTLAAERGAWLCFEDEAGHTLRPARARTWARRGRTPVITVSGKGSGRIAVAGLVCIKPGHPARMIYRMRRHRGRKHERRGFAATDYIALLDAAHQQLGAPIVVIWDNLNTHLSNDMRGLIAARDWLTVIQLPACAPELNPVETLWAHVKNGVGNLAVRNVDELAAIVKTRLKRIQYRPQIIDAFFRHTGLTLETPLA